MKRLIATGLLSAAATTVLAQTPIKIGEINSYSAIPQFTMPYKKGWQLAVEEINAQGGLLGRQVVVIDRDDAGKPDEALRHASTFWPGAFCPMWAWRWPTMPPKTSACSSPASP
jgi:branched-chain amino acid transport system substrate-binding protein